MGEPLTGKQKSTQKRQPVLRQAVSFIRLGQLLPGRFGFLFAGEQKVPNDTDTSGKTDNIKDNAGDEHQDGTGCNQDPQRRA